MDVVVLLVLCILGQSVGSNSTMTNNAIGSSTASTTCAVHGSITTLTTTAKPTTAATTTTTTTTTATTTTTTAKLATTTIKPITTATTASAIVITEQLPIPTVQKSNCSCPHMVTEEDYEEYEYDYPDDDRTGYCHYSGVGRGLLPILYTFVFIFGLLGNAVVLWVMMNQCEKLACTDLQILFLCIADLMLVCTLPFLAYQAGHNWVFGHTVCTIVLSVYYFGFHCAIYVLTLMSLERFLAVFYPNSNIYGKFSKLCVLVGIWAFGIGISVPDVMYAQEFEMHDGTKWCYAIYPTSVHTTADGVITSIQTYRIMCLLKFIVLGFIVPVVIICVCYFKILTRFAQHGGSASDASRVVVFIVVAYIVCWLPYAIAMFCRMLELLEYIQGCRASVGIRLGVQITEALAYSHTCVNPLIQLAMGSKFRKKLTMMLTRSNCFILVFLRGYTFDLAAAVAETVDSDSDGGVVIDNIELGEMRDPGVV